MKSPVPDIFDDETWAKLKAKWARDIRRDAQLVRENTLQIPADIAGCKAHVHGGLHGSCGQARHRPGGPVEAIDELFQPDEEVG